MNGNVGLLEFQVHLCALVEVNPQQLFGPTGESSGHRLTGGVRLGYDLDAQKMVSWLNLHGVNFVALNMMEHDQMFLVSSFESVGIAQLIIYPYGEMRFGEFVIFLDAQCGRYCDRRHCS